MRAVTLHYDTTKSALRSSFFWTMTIIRFCGCGSPPLPAGPPLSAPLLCAFSPFYVMPLMQQLLHHLRIVYMGNLALAAALEYVRREFVLRELGNLVRVTPPAPGAEKAAAVAATPVRRARRATARASSLCMHLFPARCPDCVRYKAWPSSSVSETTRHHLPICAQGKRRQSIVRGLFSARSKSANATNRMKRVASLAANAAAHMGERRAPYSGV